MKNRRRKKDVGDGLDSYFRHRKPIPKPGSTFKDKSKYSRRKKHKKDWE